MTAEIALSAVVANCGSQRSDDLLDMVAGGAPDVPVYRPRFEARGQVFAHIGDWQALLGTGADLIAYGSLLWTAYERFVRPRISEAAECRPALLIFLSAGGRARVHIAVDEGWTEAQLQDALVTKADELRRQTANDALELDWDFTDSARWSRYSARRHS